MFIPAGQGAYASTASAAQSDPLPATLPNAPIPREQVRHLIFGTPAAVNSDIKDLHKRGYADPNDWSRLLSTGRANEVMAILTKRVEAD